MPVRTIRRGASKRAKRAHGTKVMHELRHGAQYRRTARKFGTARARKQMVAIMLKATRQRRRKKR
jgi:hypothetical protein